VIVARGERGAHLRYGTDGHAIADESVRQWNVSKVMGRRSRREPWNQGVSVGTAFSGWERQWPPALSIIVV